MSNNMEIEAKMLLSEDEYNKLVIEILKHNPKLMSQTNYYLDTDDFKLKKYGLGLRIREKNNTYEMTLKAHLSEGLLEKSAFISKKEFENYKKGIPLENQTTEFLTILGFNTNDIHIICSLNTYRIECEYEGGLLCLDKSQYGGVEDYEIEMESNSMQNATKSLVSFLERGNVEPKEFNNIAKYQRAIKTIKKE